MRPVLQGFCGILKHALTGNQKVCKFHKSFALGLYCNLPLSEVFLPDRFNNLVVKVYIPIEIPFLDYLLDICMDFLSGSIEMTPVRIGVEWKGLELLAVVCRVCRKVNTYIDVSRHITLYPRIPIHQPGTTNVMS